MQMHGTSPCSRRNQSWRITRLRTCRGSDITFLYPRIGQKWQITWPRSWRGSDITSLFPRRGQSWQIKRLRAWRVYRYNFSISQTRLELADYEAENLARFRYNFSMSQTRLELADYEAENLARLQKMFTRKWEFIFMQAEAQSKVGFISCISSKVYKTN